MSFISSFLLRYDIHMQEILRSASVAFGIKVLAIIVTFCSNLLLARLVGAEGTGIYFLGLTITTIAAVIGRMGLDNTLLRFTASHASLEEWGVVRGASQKGLLLSLSASSVLAIVIFVIAPFLSNHVFGEPALTVPLRLMSLAIVPRALFQLYAQLLRGLKHIQNSVLLQSFWLPLFTLLGILLFVPSWGVAGAAAGYLIGALITAGIGFGLWKRATPQLTTFAPAISMRKLLDSSIPLLWQSSFKMLIQWSPTLLVGIFATSADVGIFGIANRTTMLMNFILIAVNSIAAPKFAALHKIGDTKTLGSIAKRSAKLMGVFATPMLIPLVFAPHWIMSLFGKNFEQGAIILAILAIGQYINVMTGSVGYVIVMTGNERIARNISAFCVTLIIALSLLLIPAYGVLGAAIAASFTMIVQNLLGAIVVRKKLGIWTLPIG